MPLADRLAEYIRACFTGIWVQSHEHEDALVAIARLCREEEWQLAGWDIDRGLQIAGQPAEETGSDPLAAVSRPSRAAFISTRLPMAVPGVRSIRAPPGIESVRHSGVRILSY